MSDQKYCVFNGNPAYHFLINDMSSLDCQMWGGEMKSLSKYQKDCDDTFSPWGTVAGYSLYSHPPGGQANSNNCWWGPDSPSNTVLGALSAKHAKGGLCAVKDSLSPGYVCLGQ